MRRPAWIPPWRRARHVLGLNARNLLYVHALNPRRHFPLADDKVRTKAILESAGVPTPRTIAVLRTLSEVKASRATLDAAGGFVIKPARGRQGGGILVIAGREGDDYRHAAGRLVPWTDLTRAMGDILFGVYSARSWDVVLVEQPVRAHPSLGDLARSGLPDIRIITLKSQPVMAMMRIATRASGGRANLHQGALGVGVRLSDGFASRCVVRGRQVAAHPDTGAPVTGFRVPAWDEILMVARQASACFPLPYLGVDLALDAGAGPVVMEVNVRPGLEIQNVNGQGLRRRLERLTRRMESRTVPVREGAAR